MPPASIRLAGDDVHVWQASLDRAPEEVERLAATLMDDERARADRFRFDRDRRRFVVSRGVLRAILGHYLDGPPGRVRLAYGPHGKPALAASPSSSGLRFNLSHADELALYVVARDREVGIDVECVAAAPPTGMTRFLSPREAAALHALPSSQQAAAFCAGWVRKEAYVKAKGVGLGLPLDRFDASLDPDQAIVLLRVDDDPEEGQRWSLWSVNPGPGYAAAVCVEGRDARLSYWRWP